MYHALVTVKGGLNDFCGTIHDTSHQIIVEPYRLFCLTLSSIYNHFNTLKKTALGKHCGKRLNSR